MKTRLINFKIVIMKILHYFWDIRFKANITVKEKNNKIFKIYDFGQITRMRGYTFETKEPETIKWINQFKTKDIFLDIGANIGIYSLFAASKGINVISVEPDALNYALLNLNINLNNFGGKITPYNVALHYENKFSKLNIASMEWGGALNTFDNNFDFSGEKFIPTHSQGVYGCSLDYLVENLSCIPNHLKIDVDGNEYLILKGAKLLLQNPLLKSILVELDETRKEYKYSIELIKKSGFRLIEKTHAEIFDEGKFSKVYNHIFFK